MACTVTVLLQVSTVELCVDNQWFLKKTKQKKHLPFPFLIFVFSQSSRPSLLLCNVSRWDWLPQICFAFLHIKIGAIVSLIRVTLSSFSRRFHFNWSCFLWSECQAFESFRLLLAVTLNEWTVYQRSKRVWYRLSSYIVTRRTYLTVKTVVFFSCSVCVKSIQPVFQKFL